MNSVEKHALFLEQPSLLFNTALAAVSSKSSIRSNDAMARHFGSVRISRTGIGHCSCGVWMADLDGDLGVGAHFASGDGLERRPNLSLKGCPFHDRSLTFAKHLLHPPNDNACKKSKQDHGLDAKTAFCHG